MSANNNLVDEDRFGYGKDVALDFRSDGLVDLMISVSGDIALSGGDGEDPIEQRVNNVIQQIKILLITPLGSLVDVESGQPSNVGSEVYTFSGRKITDIDIFLIRSMVLSALIHVTAIQSLDKIDVLPVKEEGDPLKILLNFTIRPDNLPVSIALSLQ